MTNAINATDKTIKEVTVKIYPEDLELLKSYWETKSGQIAIQKSLIQFAEHEPNLSDRNNSEKLYSYQGFTPNFSYGSKVDKDARRAIAIEYLTLKSGKLKYRDKVAAELGVTPHAISKWAERYKAGEL